MDTEAKLRLVTDALWFYMRSLEYIHWDSNYSPSRLVYGEVTNDRGRLARIVLRAIGEHWFNMEIPPDVKQRLAELMACEDNKTIGYQA